jgi:hypothetical protein
MNAATAIGHAKSPIGSARRVKAKLIRWRQTKKLGTLDATIPGVVEFFNRDGIIGWISTTNKDLPIKVTLNINGFPVQATWVNSEAKRVNAEDTSVKFFIGARGTWDFCRRGDRFTVTVNDEVLPILGEGNYKRVRGTGTKTLEELKTMLSNGYIFNRRGTLQLSKKLDVEWQRQMIDLYRKISKVLEKNHDITPFLMYGSLLGQVREGGFIGHDDDFDIAYVSKRRSGPAAAKELVKIGQTFIENGFDVELRATALHIHDNDDPRLRIDLFHLFFNDKKELSFPFGVAGTSQFMLSDWEGVTKARFASFSVSVPRNSEKLVECIYGASWKTPIVGFSWKHARTRRDRSGIVPHAERDKLNEVYNRKHETVSH